MLKISNACFVFQKQLVCSFFLIICFSIFSQAQIVRPTPQPEKRNCGSVIDLQKIFRDPVKKRRFLANEKKLRNQLNQMRSGLNLDMDRVYKIPVVFHIVLPDPSVITNAMIDYQLSVMNNDFAGTNGDSANAFSFYNRRGHLKFEYVLAKRSPDGCDTNGITRTVSNLAVGSGLVNLIKHSASGGHDMWESYNCHYLNVWVGQVNGTLLGEATFPIDPDEETPASEQGVFIRSTTFLNNPVSGNFTLGRTMVHEVGHYFNLRHIWGDEDACAEDDGVDDTPKQAESTSGNPLGTLFDACSPAASITGINYQNYMDYTWDAGLTMFTKLQDSIMVASLFAFPNRASLISPKNKALTPKEGNQLYTICNTGVFTTDNFTCVGVGKNNVVWAGTSQNGLYNFSGGKWHKYGFYNNNLYQDIKADKEGGMWVAQSGYNGAQAQTGGMLYFPDTTFPATANYYSASSGLPSRYPRNIFIDTTRLTGGSTPLVWTANFANITAGVSSNGGLGRGFNANAPNFSAIRTGLEPADVNGGTASCYYLAGNSSEIWTHTQNNFGLSQILVHDAITNQFIVAYDTTNSGLDGLVSGNFNAKSLYFDSRGNKWMTVNNSGILVFDSLGIWQKADFSKIFPTTKTFNNGAMAGDADGNVYIGTTTGLIVYSGGGDVDKDSSYTLYTTANGLPTNNIKGIAIDTFRQKVLLATDAGIMFWNPTCAAGPQSDIDNFSTIGPGDWNNPAIWCNGVVPPLTANVIIAHAVTITADAQCKSLRLIETGTFTVSPGVDFNVGP